LTRILNRLYAISTYFGVLDTGWQRPCWALTAGVMAAAAMPPVFAVVFLIPGFVIFFKLLEAASSGRRAFVVGWWFGVGHFAAGLYWVSYAFMVEADVYGALAPVAVVMMAAGMALFTGLFAWMAAKSFKYIIASAARVFVFAALWVVVEWIRSWAFTGFPWNLMGTVWSFSDVMMQGASLFSVYGLSLLTVFMATAPVLIIKPGPVFRDKAVVAFAALSGLALFAFGYVRLPVMQSEFANATRLRLVQPNVAQKLKWKRELRARHVRQLIDLSLSPYQGKAADIVIWPEAAVPYDLANTGGLKQAIGTAAPPGGVVLLGAPKGSPRGQRPFRIWNSLFAVNPDGRVAATYDKAHLVPFGEYLPFRNIIGDRFGKLTAGRTDFTPGPGPKTVKLKNRPAFSPLICYEVIFPDAVVDKTNRPEWLLNLTNDGWFGLSAGPYQHLAAARLRAVEQGLPLIRVANTGVSVATDSYGRITGQIGLGEQGVLDVDLPPKLKTLTLYARFGNVVPAVLVFVFFALGGLLGRTPPIKT